MCCFLKPTCLNLFLFMVGDTYEMYFGYLIGKQEKFYSKTFQLNCLSIRNQRIISSLDKQSVISINNASASPTRKSNIHLNDLKQFTVHQRSRSWPAILATFCGYGNRIGTAWCLKLRSTLPSLTDENNKAFSFNVSNGTVHQDFLG